MHSYLRAIGFSNIDTRKKLNDLFDEITLNTINDKSLIRESKAGDFVEISMDFADDLGITFFGEYDENQKFHIDHYFPHIKCQTIGTKEEIGINKRVDAEAYTGMCDDYRLGVSLIFFMQNVAEYLDKKQSNLFVPSKPYGVQLAALSLEGRILLPIEKDEVTVNKISAETKYRNNLINEAKKGNQEAIDSLTIDDIDTYAMVSKRAKKEDIYSIVDTCFIPFGSESDNYSIMATILEANLIINKQTKEEIYDMQLICNDIIFRLGINKEDLVGEPQKGRRFKGNVWMQGNVHFSE